MHFSVWPGSKQGNITAKLWGCCVLSHVIRPGTMPSCYVQMANQKGTMNKVAIYAKMFKQLWNS